MNPLVGLLLNVIVPWDFFLGGLIARLRERLETLVPLWLDRSAELEAAGSLANFGYLNPGCAFPCIERVADSSSRQFVFEATALGHPLIPASMRVSNDFSLGDTQLVVLTGSNMSGKSTFLKTLGINMVLAYAGAPVCAASLRLGLFRPFSCIRVTDSVQDHVSTFFAEVRRLKQLLDALGTPDARPLFYLVDEIFRGTNNRERVAGGRAFMAALLGQNGAGAISTHDLELAFAGEGLARVTNYHFREELTGRRMIFDYKLRRGISPTTNALKIMEIEGLPIGPRDL
jgi:DNA mismatch repair ATPase MutS